MVELLPTDPTQVRLQSAILGCTPTQVYSHWTTSTLLERWWVGVVRELDVKPGGVYHFAWPQQDMHLRGEYTALSPNRHLAFTWAWDRETTAPRLVEVDLAEAGTGTMLTIHHSTYTDNDQNERQSHIDGWLYFIDRLEKLLL